MVARKPPRRRRLKPLKSSAAFNTFVLDQLTDVGGVTSRAMFGGVGLYCDGLFFGIVAGDTLYLKVDDGNRADYQRAGMPPFTPYEDRSGTMEYFAVPVDVLESGFELTAWAAKAVAAAGRAGRKAGRAGRAGGAGQDR